MSKFRESIVLLLILSITSVCKPSRRQETDTSEVPVFQNFSSPDIAFKLGEFKEINITGGFTEAEDLERLNELTGKTGKPPYAHAEVVRGHGPSLLAEEKALIRRNLVEFLNSYDPTKSEGRLPLLSYQINTGGHWETEIIDLEQIVKSGQVDFEHWNSMSFKDVEYGEHSRNWKKIREFQTFMKDTLTELAGHQEGTKINFPLETPEVTTGTLDSEVDKSLKTIWKDQRSDLSSHFRDFEKSVLKTAGSSEGFTVRSLEIDENSYKTFIEGSSKNPEVGILIMRNNETGVDITRKINLRVEKGFSDQFKVEFDWIRPNAKEFDEVNLTKSGEKNLDIFRSKVKPGTVKVKLENRAVSGGDIRSGLKQTLNNCGDAGQKIIAHRMSGGTPESFLTFQAGGYEKNRELNRYLLNRHFHDAKFTAGTLEGLPHYPFATEDEVRKFDAIQAEYYREYRVDQSQIRGDKTLLEKIIFESKLSTYQQWIEAGCSLSTARKPHLMLEAQFNLEVARSAGIRPVDLTNGTVLQRHDFLEEGRYKLIKVTSDSDLISMWDWGKLGDTIEGEKLDKLKHMKKFIGQYNKKYIDFELDLIKNYGTQDLKKLDPDVVLKFLPKVYELNMMKAVLEFDLEALKSGKTLLTSDPRYQQITNAMVKGEELTGRLKLLDEDILSLRSQLALGSSLEVSQLKKKIQEFSVLNSELLIENERLRSSVIDLQKSLDALDLEKTALGLEVDRLRKHGGLSENEVLRRIQEIESRYKQKVEKLESSLRLHETELQAVKEKNDFLVQKLKEQYDEKIIALSEENSSLKKKIAKIELENQNTLREISGLRDQIILKDKTIRSRDSTIGDLQQKIRDLESRPPSSLRDAELQSLKNSLDLEKAEKIKVDQELSVLNKQHLDLKNSLENKLRSEDSGTGKGFGWASVGIAALIAAGVGTVVGLGASGGLGLTCP